MGQRGQDREEGDREEGDRGADVVLICHSAVEGPGTAV